MKPRLRRAWRRGTVALAVPIVAVVVPGVAHATILPATPATFASVFASAKAGDIVQLASGDYGVFRGALEPGMVTIQAAAGAKPTMSVYFRPAANITLDGLAITHLEIGNSASKNLVVRNSSFDQAQTIIRTSEVVNANIVFDHNTHIGFVKCSSCYEGRVELPGRTSQPSGVTIENSLFSGGDSDGIQNGGNGVRILDNEFEGIHQIDSASGVHADSIQLYGSANTMIRGNYFHDVAVGVMAADGADHETIEDNVFAVSGSPYAVTLLSDNGSIFRHNTLLDYGTCDYGLRCGTLYVGNKSVDPPSRGTIVTDNIITRICLCDGSTRGFAQEDYNLFTNDFGAGAHDLRGTPTYVGGPSPSSWDGFALASGSIGKGSASDGTDRGAAISSASPSPSPSPDQPAEAVWTAPSGAVIGTPTVLDGTRSTGDAPLTCTWRFENADGSTVWDTAAGCLIQKTFTTVGTKYVRLVVTDADGDTNSNKQSFYVGSAPTTDQPATAVWTAPSHVVVGTPTILDGTRSTGNLPLTCTWSFENADGSIVWDTAAGCLLQKTFTSPGTKYVRLIVTDADGDTNSNKQSFVVGGT